MTEDSCRESTILILDPQVQNQGRVRSIPTVVARRSIPDISPVPPLARPHTQRTIRPLIGMGHLWIPTRDVLQS